MKGLTKRGIALLIDGIIFGILYVCVERILPDWFMNLGALGKIILFIPFFCKDLLFKNASLGKKLLGVSIYTSTWEVPGALQLIKRSV